MNYRALAVGAVAILGGAAFLTSCDYHAPVITIDSITENPDSTITVTVTVTDQDSTNDIESIDIDLSVGNAYLGSRFLNMSTGVHTYHASFTVATPAAGSLICVQTNGIYLLHREFSEKACTTFQPTAATTSTSTTTASSTTTTTLWVPETSTTMSCGAPSC